MDTRGVWTVLAPWMKSLETIRTLAQSKVKRVIEREVTCLSCVPLWLGVGDGVHRLLTGVCLAVIRARCFRFRFRYLR